MKNVTFDKKSLIVDGQRKYFISGEFHYFRVPRSDWARRMKLFLDTGGNCIATYVPWIIHEQEEGKILFDDCDERALSAFLELADSMGLMVVLRPGPYQYSELRLDGLPLWLYKKYPEVLALDINGNELHKASVSYLHPLFVEKTKKYYKAFYDVVKPFLDRNVAMIQVDNELAGIHIWRGSIDYHPTTMGFGKEDGRYATYLKHKYGDVAKLNAAYETSFSSFAEAHPSIYGKDRFCELRSKYDYYHFYYSTIGEFGKLLKDYLRELGAKNLICHNVASRTMIADFKEFMDVIGDDCLLGFDNYYTLNYTWAQNNPTPQYYVRSLCANDVLREMGQPPMVLEMPGGSPSDVPPILENDLYTCYMANMAAGMKGVNYYIYTGGPNPEGMGETADIYDYCAFVSADGSLKETYNALMRFNTFASTNEHILKSDRQTSVSIGFEWDMLRADKYFSGTSLRLAKFPTLTEQTIGLSLLSTEYSGEYTNIAKKLDPSKPVILLGTECMSEKAQNNLIEFIENGGSLILLSMVPTLDFDLNECTTLRDYLSEEFIPYDTFSPLTKIFEKNVYRIDKQTRVAPSSRMCPFAYDEENNIVGFEKHLGNGKVIFLGGSWLAGNMNQIKMLEELLELAGAKPVARSSNPAIIASVFSDGNEVSVFVLNLYTGTAKTNLSVYDTQAPYRKIIFQEDLSLSPLEVKYIKIK